MFERIKRIHGREYRYLVIAERKGNTVKQKVVKYLGPVNPVYKKDLTRKRESNAWLFVREINTAERELLEKAQISSSAFTRDRARIILHSMKGMPCNQIDEKIGCEARKVRNAINAFNTHGIDALKRQKAPGAKPKLSKEPKAQVLMIAATEPKKLHLHFTTWSLQKLQQYLINQGVVDSISIETIRSLLKQERMKLRKSRRFQYSNDPQFAKKNSGSTR